MTYPIEPTLFPDNPFRPEWANTDFFDSQDGIGDFPEHHCKLTYQVSEQYLSRVFGRDAIDVGCRDGEYTRYVLRNFRRAFCFEPRERDRFPVNVDLSRVTHFQCAVGDFDGEIHMFGGTHNPDHPGRRIVPCFTLDRFGLEDIGYVKIDVEGFERRVLVGAEQTIARCRPLIVVEQNDVKLAGEDTFGAKAWLEERGYVHVATCPRGWDYIMVPDDCKKS